MKNKIISLIEVLVIIILFYIFFLSNIGKISIEFEKMDGNQPVIKEEGELVVKQKLWIEHNKFSGIEIQFATFMKENEGYVTLNLYSQEGNKILTNRIAKKNILDNQYYTWYFSPLKDSKNKEYMLEIVIEDDGKDNRVTVYMGENANANQKGIYIDGKIYDQAINMRALYIQ